MISLNDKKAGFLQYIHPRKLLFFSTLAHHASNHSDWWIWMYCSLSEC